jgi:hypothetical protein
MMWDAIAILTGPQNLAVRDQGVCYRPRTSRLAVVLVSSPSGILATESSFCRLLPLRLQHSTSPILRPAFRYKGFRSFAIHTCVDRFPVFDI